MTSLSSAAYSGMCIFTPSAPQPTQSRISALRYLHERQVKVSHTPLRAMINVKSSCRSTHQELSYGRRVKVRPAPFRSSDIYASYSLGIVCIL